MELRPSKKACKWCHATIYWAHPYVPGDRPYNSDGTRHACRAPQDPDESREEGLNRDQLIDLLERAGITTINNKSLRLCNIKELSERYTALVTERLGSHDAPAPDAPKEDVPPPIPGQHREAMELAMLLKEGFNVWVAGPAGSGKTHSSVLIGQGLGMHVFRVPCGQQTVMSSIFGYTNAATGEYVPGMVWRAVEVARQGQPVLIIWDEFDRLNPGVGVNCNGVLDGSPVTFPNGETVVVRNLVTQVVCANTWGRPTPEFPTANAQDAATLTRFVRLWWTYDEEFEKSLYHDLGSLVDLGQRIRRTVMANGIRTIAVTMRTFDAMCKFKSLGKSQDYMLNRLVWTGASKDDAHKVANALNLRIPAEAQIQWQG